MEKNVGGIDRIVRIVLGIVFLVVGALQGGPWWILAAAFLRRREPFSF